MAKTKMCNIEDVDKSVKYLGKDIGEIINKIEGGWKYYYHKLPEGLQNIFDRYPITIASMIIIGTNEYTAAIMAFEEVAHRTINRGKDAKDHENVAEQQGKNWKKDIIQNGLVLVTVNESVDAGSNDWNKQTNYVPKEYETPWQSFLGCVDASEDIQGANKCIRQLKIDIATL